jgi:hypothetical protein
VLLFALPSGAHAASQRTDPTADSPAGVIYQIPLDSGRRDAAPLPGGKGKRNASSNAGSGGGASGGGGTTGGGGTSGGGGTTGGGTAASGSGSSSSCGGSAAAPWGSPGSVSASAPLPGGATPDSPSSIHSENGFGSSSKVPGVDAPTPVAADTQGGGGSNAPVYLLIALIAGLAVWVGASAARSAARV